MFWLVSVRAGICLVWCKGPCQGWPPGDRGVTRGREARPRSRPRYPAAAFIGPPIVRAVWAAQCRPAAHRGPGVGRPGAGSLCGSVSRSDRSLIYVIPAKHPAAAVCRANAIFLGPDNILHYTNFAIIFPMAVSSLVEAPCSISKKHLYNICTMLDQRRRRWADIVRMLYKCFVFDGSSPKY